MNDTKTSRISKIFGMFRPDAKYGRFLTTLLLSGIAYGLYRGVQDNYLAQIVHISEFERGIVEFFRELPGLLVVFILAAVYRWSETRIFKIGTAIMLAGVVGLAVAGTGKFIVILFVVIFSLGEHIIMPVRSTIAMDLAKKDAGGSVLGIIGSLGQIGNIVGFLAVSGIFILFSFLGNQAAGATDSGSGFGEATAFRLVFAISAALMTGALLISLTMQESALKPARKRFYFAKKFSKYYMLEVFYGARKQVFLTFAPYVLILHYGADASVISALFAISAICGAIVSPLIGKLIDKFGYRTVMIADTLILVIVCLLYGYSHRLFSVGVAFIVVCVNYVLDSIISLGSMATNVYVKDIADSSEEVVATLSTGVSVNHVISILIALVGGWIWAQAGIELLFTISAILGVLNTLYAATIKKPGSA